MSLHISKITSQIPLGSTHLIQPHRTKKKARLGKGKGLAWRLGGRLSSPGIPSPKAPSLAGTCHLRHYRGGALPLKRESLRKELLRGRSYGQSEVELELQGVGSAQLQGALPGFPQQLSSCPPAPSSSALPKASFLPAGAKGAPALWSPGG